MSPRFSLIVCAFLASASALAEPQVQLGGLPGALPPAAPSDTVAVVKALAHATSDLQKFVDLNPKAQISQAQVTYQDDGYQVTITSQTCADTSLPPQVSLPQPEAPLPVDGGLTPLPGGDPFGSLPPVGLPFGTFGGLGPSCKTYGMLVIQASADADAQDGYTYQVFWNSTVRKK